MTAYLGIDIAKATFTVCLWKEQQRLPVRTFANNPAGMKQLGAWLRAQDVSDLHCCMEATNVYYEGVAEFLYAQGYQVSVVNPWQIKAYAHTRLRRHKNDPLDANDITDFCRLYAPRPWQPLTPAQKRLQQLVRHLDTLKTSCQQQRNRLGTCRDQLVAASLQRVIDIFETEIKQTQQDIEAHFETHPTLKQQLTLLLSIPGIGQQTAATLIGELPTLADYPSAKQVAAEVGLTPTQRLSGTSVQSKPRLSKIGNPRVRKALYFPALSALRHNPIIIQLQERLQLAGKAKMVIVGAAMRKLIHIAYGVLKNRTPFDPNFASSS